MQYRDPRHHFFFTLPDTWRHEPSVKHPTFFGPRGRIGSRTQVIQVIAGPIMPEYVDPESRKRYLDEPGATVVDSRAGNASSAVELRRADHAEISVVHCNVHLVISHDYDPATQEAVESLRNSLVFERLNRPMDPTAALTVDRLGRSRAAPFSKQTDNMNPEHPVIQALALIKSGDRAFDAGDPARALSSFNEARSLAQKVPADEWDQEGFLAVCSACISGALGALGRAEEAAQEADRAILFFDRHGHMYPLEHGRWVMATFNKGAALAQLDRPSEALVLIRKAKSMLPAGAEHQRLRSMCDHNIKLIEDMLVQCRNRSRPWWKFW